jgi:hypothetical protein
MVVAKRKKVGGFAYSLGSYPMQDFAQDEGFVINTVSSDEDFEARFEYEVFLSCERIVDLLVRLTALLPEEIYLILESYPHSSSQKRIYLTDSTRSRGDFTRCLRRFSRLWRDEGFVSFGAFSYDPPVEIFLNEHKTVMIYTPYMESTDEILADFGLSRFEVLEAYYTNVEHVHSSIADTGPDGELSLLKDRVESELFSRYDFYDQTPVLGEEDEGEYAGDVIMQEDVADEDGLPSWRCHVHGRLVVAPEGRPRDFHQVFCIAAPDESFAAGWVRESLRERNARMVRVQELELIEASCLDPAVRPVSAIEQEGVWYESERVFLGDVS